MNAKPTRKHRKKLDAKTKQQISDSMRASWAKRKKNFKPVNRQTVAEDLKRLSDAGQLHIASRVSRRVGDTTTDYEAELMGKTNKELRIIAATRARDLEYASETIKEASRRAAASRIVVRAALHSLGTHDFEVDAVRCILSSVVG